MHMLRSLRQLAGAARLTPSMITSTRSPAARAPVCGRAYAIVTPALLGDGGSKGPGGNGRGSSGGGSGSSGSSGGAHWGRSLLGAIALSALSAGPALAAKKEEKKVAFDLPDDMTIDNVTDVLWNIAGPIVTNLGFSGMIGLVCGLALRQVGKVLAVIIGLAFCALQAPTTA
ncbi:hypothetical protein FOA52_002011 [Chlamydomonas sp. UWO 241]|nr:hypothetical protein FOA52_002011 [Chlamydomonas sp. UWO 241]